MVLSTVSKQGALISEDPTGREAHVPEVLALVSNPLQAAHFEKKRERPRESQERDAR